VVFFQISVCRFLHDSETLTIEVMIPQKHNVRLIEFHFSATWEKASRESAGDPLPDPLHVKVAELVMERVTVRKQATPNQD
jgi:hypothetical protein